MFNLRHDCPTDTLTLHHPSIHSTHNAQTAFPLSASPASRLARRCLLLALLAALLLTLAAPSLLRLPAGRGRGQGAARLAGALRSAREDFGPGEWLALQSGYWQPRDYVKEVGVG